MYLNLCPPDRSLVPRDVQDASRADVGAISKLSERLWKAKNTVKYKVFAVFHVAPQTSSRTSKSAPGRSQNHPQERPGAARDAPGEAQEASRQPYELPRAPPESPKHGFRTALALGPTGAKEPSGGLPQAPRAGVAPPGGRFSYSFLLSESIAKAVLWAKLAQAYAQHRFTSLCNFYMWISTATDSKSID